MGTEELTFREGVRESRAVGENNIAVHLSWYGGSTIGRRRPGILNDVWVAR